MYGVILSLLKNKYNVYIILQYLQKQTQMSQTLQVQTHQIKDINTQFIHLRHN